MRIEKNNGTSSLDLENGKLSEFLSKTTDQIQTINSFSFADYGLFGSAYAELEELMRNRVAFLQAQYLVIESVVHGNETNSGEILSLPETSPGVWDDQEYESKLASARAELDRQSRSQSIIEGMISSLGGVISGVDGNTFKSDIERISATISIQVLETNKCAVDDYNALSGTLYDEALSACSPEVKEAFVAAGTYVTTGAWPNTTAWRGKLNEIYAKKSIEHKLRIAERTLTEEQFLAYKAALGNDGIIESGELYDGENLNEQLVSALMTLSDASLTARDIIALGNAFLIAWDNGNNPDFDAVEKFLSLSFIPDGVSKTENLPIDPVCLHDGSLRSHAPSDIYRFRLSSSFSRMADYLVLNYEKNYPATHDGQSLNDQYRKLAVVNFAKSFSEDNKNQLLWSRDSSRLPIGLSACFGGANSGDGSIANTSLIIAEVNPGERRLMYGAEENIKHQLYGNSMYISGPPSGCISLVTDLMSNPANYQLDMGAIAYKTLKNDLLEMGAEKLIVEVTEKSPAGLLVFPVSFYFDVLEETDRAEQFQKVMTHVNEFASAREILSSDSLGGGQTPLNEIGFGLSLDMSYTDSDYASFEDKDALKNRIYVPRETERAIRATWDDWGRRSADAPSETFNYKAYLNNLNYMLNTGAPMTGDFGSFHSWCGADANLVYKSDISDGIHKPGEPYDRGVTSNYEYASNKAWDSNTNTLCVPYDEYASSNE